MRMYFLSQRHPHWSVGVCPHVAWVGWGEEGREESLGRRLSPQTQLFLFLRGSKLLRGMGYTPHGQLKSENKFQLSI